MRCLNAQDDTWTVINSFFAEKGLVRQQLDSYNTFLGHTLLEQIKDQSDRGIEVESNVQVVSNLSLVREQYRTYDENNGEKVKVAVTMEYLGMTRPTVPSSGGEQPSELWPCEARLRNLTYSSSIHVRMTQTTERTDPEKPEPEKSTRVTSYCLCRVCTMLSLSLSSWEFLIRQIPTMIRSDPCNLYNKTDDELAEMGECIYDQGGYFIINGSEKAIIAQERQTTNKVYVFKRKEPSKFSWTAEIRSIPEGSNIPAQALKLGMFAKESMSSKQNQYCIWAYPPQLSDGVPICILFRALGCVDDRSIMERICYVRMMNDE